MKKAFDANVSRAKPRVRLGALMTEASLSAAAVESLAQQVAHEAPVIPSVMEPADSMDLSSALKARAQARANRSSAAEMLQEALSTVPAPRPTPAVEEPRAAWDAHEENPRAFAAAAAAAPVAQSRPWDAHAEKPRAAELPVAQSRAVVAPQAAVEAPVARSAVHAPVVEAPRAFVESQPVVEAPRAHAEPPPAVTEVQTAPPPHLEQDTTERRERLRERLKAVRENPRPEPLPDTVAEAGVLAVERISALQTELAKARAMNLALAQDLEAARRQAERATEEARLRMDEAKRLSSEMEGRVTLLSELERELESLEGERNESLLALQEARQVLELREREKQELVETVAKKDQEISDSLAEEERLAAELETAQEAMTSLRRGADALKGERDTLARQVSELTRERAELLEARKALEAVHRALSSAAMR